MNKADSFVSCHIVASFATTAGQHNCSHWRLMDRLNTVARLVYTITTAFLHRFQWLRVLERIKFRLAVLSFHCRKKTALAYLTNDDS